MIFAIYQLRIYIYEKNSKKDSIAVFKNSPNSLNDPHMYINDKKRLKDDMCVNNIYLCSIFSFEHV